MGFKKLLGLPNSMVNLWSKNQPKSLTIIKQNKIKAKPNSVYSVVCAIPYASPRKRCKWRINPFKTGENHPNITISEKRYFKIGEYVLYAQKTRIVMREADSAIINDPIIKNIFAGLRPVVVGLIGAAALLLMNRENFTDNTFSIAIAAIAFALTYFTKVHPILIIVLAGVAGYIIY